MRMGISVEAEPEGTFYVWANLEQPAGAAERRHAFLRRRP